ncbi:exodeoxyribonuclease III [Anoxybacterium hadale]|uniref:Exodeoxyribonuclease III n=1 Tax=Anoxybacterium hadale TaxID=3408580 RepID=A0ACD1A822_9FIRM|nr:exodeoxyribonuclease III [Clostridiales bacterium]
MKLITWNVNGLRACLGKGFLDFCKEQNPDCICIQETKMQEGQVEIILEGYEQYWNSAEKKGYSGTAIFSKEKPISINYDINAEGHDKEGRAVTLEFPEFYLITVYTPNSQEKLARLDYRMEWEDAFRSYVTELDEKKPVIICGDLNVAHQEIDLKNPAANRKNAGFSDEERAKMTELLDSGFTDTFRHLYPDATGIYTWWSYRFNARANNAGWRIDYFLASDRIKDKIKDVVIFDQVFGSDHCPVMLDIEL